MEYWSSNIYIQMDQWNKKKRKEKEEKVVCININNQLIIKAKTKTIQHCDKAILSISCFCPN